MAYCHIIYKSPTSKPQPHQNTHQQSKTLSTYKVDLHLYI
jgi:hypothetical protein